MDTKNPEGDFSRSVVNKSALLKSERGNLIIKAKTLTNVSNSEPVEFLSFRLNLPKCAASEISCVICRCGGEMDY